MKLPEIVWTCVEERERAYIAQWRKRGRQQRRFMDAVKDMQRVEVTEQDMVRDRMILRQMIRCPL